MIMPERDDLAATGELARIIACAPSWFAGIKQLPSPTAQAMALREASAKLVEAHDSIKQRGGVLVFVATVDPATLSNEHGSRGSSASGMCIDGHQPEAVQRELERVLGSIAQALDETIRKLNEGNDGHANA